MILARNAKGIIEMSEIKAKLDESPKVTVVVPVYNAEKYLRECIESIADQTLEEIEMIFVDDGSTDKSLDILKEYEKKDSRISVITQEHANAGVARNRGLSVATGEYLSFLDADDFFEPNMLEKAYDKAKNEKAEIIVYRSDAFDVDNASYREMSFSIWEKYIPDSSVFAGIDIKYDFFSAFVGWTWDKLFMRDYIEKKGFLFQEQRTTNDLLFTYLSLAAAKKITILEEILVHHRIHISTSLEATREKSYICFYHALLALREGLKEQGLYKRFKQDFINYSLRFSIENLNALSGNTKIMLYKTLKHECFKELGLAGQTRKMYYRRKDFYKYKFIMFLPDSKVTFFLVKKLRI